MNNEAHGPSLWRLLLVVGALAAVGGGAALADYTVGAGEPVVISDDVFDRTTEVVSLAGPAGPTSGSAIPTSGDTSGTGNNGHGNNLDGVDSSNPGQGSGGPNGAVDTSCDPSGTCVDDEATGGGASPSKK